jgi:signal transduction histidine kinase
MADQADADELGADVAAVARIGGIPLILDIVCRSTGMGFAAVARVTEERWVACSVLDKIAFGLQPGGELQVRTTICDQIRCSGEAVLVDDTACDPVYQKHPTPALYGFRSYVSVPILRGDGSFFGTLCAIDPKARHVKTPEVRSMFEAFASLIGRQLDDVDRLDEGRRALEEERRLSVLRDEFIAVLGHDLRNPLAAIDAGIRFMSRQALDERGLMVVQMMRGSVRRMVGLIDDVLDFARGRLGEGLTLDFSSSAALEPVLTQVVDEVRAASPGRSIETRFALVDAVRCDRGRIGQMVSNMLANAVTHGAPDGVIYVDAVARGGGLELSVRNAGQAIPPVAMASLFLPFYRNTVRPSAQGLGLGLYIVAMIAEAHGGKMEVVSSDAETRFTFRMPA